MLGQTVLSMPGLWICLIVWHVQQAFGVPTKPGSEYGTVAYARVTHNRVSNISDYGSILVNKAWMCLNMP